MPGRQTYSSLPSAKKSKQKSRGKKNRALDAFALAQEQVSDLPKLRKNRLGDIDGGQRPGKRQRREEDDDDDEEGDEAQSKRSRKSGGRSAEVESDSEGNEWVMGEVPSDDDSELDSDEAFDESDEEHFGDMAFSGSSKNARKQEESDSDAEDGDDLGEDAIDLAAMLDATEEESRERLANDPKTQESGSSDEDSDDASSVSSMDEADEDEDDPEKLAALQDLIASLPQPTKAAATRDDGANEYDKPSDFGIASQNKLTLEDLGLPGVSDPHVKKSLKFLSDAAPSNKKGTVRKLAVPLPKRQQDSLDRSAAYDETKTTMKRWVDTVQHNRQADHLIFPLPDPDKARSLMNSKLQPTTKPFNDLEAAIQNILEESGLGAADGKDDESKIQEYEELETSKMTLEEVKARRAQLRMARELMFREEARAKRIKKIKSKSYRRVHRKQREREAEMEQQALEEAGLEPSEDEKERQDRRRAMERMGSKHRDSKWAKATKEIGRAAWDEEARSGIVEMARRNEELRRRVEGKTRGDDESESSDDEDDEAAGSLLRKLDSVAGADAYSGPGSKLANMKFMRNAEAARKKLNDETVEQIRRDLAGEDSDDEEVEVQDVGRRVFGAKPSLVPTDHVERRQFEEPEGHESDGSIKVTTSKEVIAGPAQSTHKKAAPSLRSPAPVDGEAEGGAWSKVVNRRDVSQVTAARVRKQKLNSANVEIDLSQAAIAGKKPQPKSSGTLEVESESDDDNANTLRLPYAIKDQELIKRAFAGADVVGDFEAEKAEVVDEEDEKMVDTTLPGWGSWVGDGMSKREQAKNTGRFFIKKEGVKAKDRRDAKLERVIINEKRVKKNDKYLASSLPHLFETKQQYERSLRIPVGPEWTTKETYQDSTKPRLLVKQGIITPMSRPLL